jgi:hypothetical protein
MKAILIDDQRNVKIIALNPTDRIDVVDRFIPCGGCGLATLYEHTVDGICLNCGDSQRSRYEKLEKLGWTWEHPGYWRKNFGDRITVIAGTGEYRFDFFFGNEAYDLGYGPELSIEVEEWSTEQPKLEERNCFGPQELLELRLVYDYLYKDMMTSKDNSDWSMESGGLCCPDGLRADNRAFETEPLHITKQMLWGVDCGEMTQNQHNQFAELMNLLAAWLDSTVE